MTVWRLDKKVGTGENVWYSENVIKRIYKIASLYVCSNCETDSKCKEKGIRCGAKMIVDIIDKESEGKLGKYELQVGETKFTIPKENLKLLAMQKAIELKRFVEIKSDADAKDFFSRIGIVVRDCEDTEKEVTI